MSKKIHKTPQSIVSILDSAAGFKQITGTPGFSGKARMALKNSKAYRPDGESTGFGSRPSFSLGSGMDTIKSDPDAYSKILSGHSRKSAKQGARYAKSVLARPHRSKRPQVDPEIVAKYSRKKNQPKHRPDRATPSVALTYTFGPSALTLRPKYSVAFKGARDAARALGRGEIMLDSLVHFVSTKKESIFTEAFRLGIYLRS